RDVLLRGGVDVQTVSINEDPFVTSSHGITVRYFKGRSKRMIISSGYNIYPAQLENIIDAHEDVQMSCVIGVPDSYKMQKVKAFVTLKPGTEPSDEIKESIMTHCRKHLAKYEMPYDIEFRDDMPKTLVGKVAYRVLEEEELMKLKENENKE
ncbi:MAG: hypothetical protein J5365_06815, partial [Erysipelotrichaceae bacterium]|nr:hypothetical protein [Erysipelotrichaceae bacterium]